MRLNWVGDDVVDVLLVAHGGAHEQDNVLVADLNQGADVAEVQGTETFIRALKLCLRRRVEENKDMTIQYFKLLRLRKNELDLITSLRYYMTIVCFT